MRKKSGVKVTEALHDRQQRGCAQEGGGEETYNSMKNISVQQLVTLKLRPYCRHDNTRTMTVRVQAVMRQTEGDGRENRRGQEETQRGEEGEETDGAQREESSDLFGGNVSTGVSIHCEITGIFGDDIAAVQSGKIKERHRSNSLRSMVNYE